MERGGRGWAFLLVGRLMMELPCLVIAAAPDVVTKDHQPKSFIIEGAAHWSPEMIRKGFATDIRMSPMLTPGAPWATLRATVEQAVKNSYGIAGYCDAEVTADWDDARGGLVISIIEGPCYRSLPFQVLGAPSQLEAEIRHRLTEEHLPRDAKPIPNPADPTGTPLFWATAYGAPCQLSKPLVGEDVSPYLNPRALEEAYAEIAHACFLHGYETPRHHVRVDIDREAKTLRYVVELTDCGPQLVAAEFELIGCRIQEPEHLINVAGLVAGMPCTWANLRAIEQKLIHTGVIRHANAVVASRLLPIDPVKVTVHVAEFSTAAKCDLPLSERDKLAERCARWCSEFHLRSNELHLLGEFSIPDLSISDGRFRLAASPVTGAVVEVIARHSVAGEFGIAADLQRNKVRLRWLGSRDVTVYELSEKSRPMLVLGGSGARIATTAPTSAQTGERPKEAQNFFSVSLGDHPHLLMFPFSQGFVRHLLSQAVTQHTSETGLCEFEFASGAVCIQSATGQLERASFRDECLSLTLHVATDAVLALRHELFADTTPRWRATDEDFWAPVACFVCQGLAALDLEGVPDWSSRAAAAVALLDKFLACPEVTSLTSFARMSEDSFIPLVDDSPLISVNCWTLMSILDAWLDLESAPRALIRQYFHMLAAKDAPSIFRLEAAVMHPDCGPLQLALITAINVQYSPQIADVFATLAVKKCEQPDDATFLHDLEEFLRPDGNFGRAALAFEGVLRENPDLVRQLMPRGSDDLLSSAPADADHELTRTRTLLLSLWNQGGREVLLAQLKKRVPRAETPPATPVRTAGAGLFDNAGDPIRLRRLQIGHEK